MRHRTLPGVPKLALLFNLTDSNQESRPFGVGSLFFCLGAIT